MTQFDGAKFDEPAREPQPMSGQSTMPKAREELTEEELKSLVEIPGVFCSRFYISLTDGAMVRLFFADTSQDRDPTKQLMVPRFGCVMTIAGFMNFANLIQNTSAQLMQKIMQMQGVPNIGGVPQPADPNKEKID